MLERHYKYILLGGGVASSAAAEAIRQRDSAGSILLVGREVNRPYDRPRLISHYLKGLRGRMEIVAHTPEWFSRRNIELRTGSRVAQLDTSRRGIALESGEEIAFDKLLIATGASAKALDVPGANLPNVFTLRSVHDADRLHHAIEKSLAGGTRHAHGRGVVAIVGGGLLGVELAGVLTDLGLQVELLVQGPHPWAKFAGASVGTLLSRYLANRGAHLHLNQSVARLTGDGRVQHLWPTDGNEISCDFVIAAIGISPSKEILRGTPIQAEKAILVDAHCRTNVPNIFAAGDCSAIFDPLFGKYRLIDHWESPPTNRHHRRRDMAGDAVAYAGVNHFHSSVFDLEMNCWGEPKQVHRRHERGTVNVDAPDLIEIGVASDGRVAQAVTVNHPGENSILESLVQQRVNVGEKEEVLVDPNYPLSSLAS